jgi:endonuclease YncB( thermonuclease family)
MRHTLCISLGHAPVLRSALRRTARAAFVAACLLAPFHAHAGHAAQWLQGSISQVVDGDTVYLLPDTPPADTALAANKPLKIRLAGIDAPECGMPGGPQARAYLLHWLQGQTVQAHARGHDRYGRTVATLFVQGEDVNLHLVAAGWAWHDPRYTGKPRSAWAQRYAQAQTQARSRALGLWQSSGQTAPWDWRRQARQAGYHYLPCGLNAAETNPEQPAAPKGWEKQP